MSRHSEEHNEVHRLSGGNLLQHETEQAEQSLLQYVAWELNGLEEVVLYFAVFYNKICFPFTIV